MDLPLIFSFIKSFSSIERGGNFTRDEQHLSQSPQTEDVFTSKEMKNSKKKFFKREKKCFLLYSKFTPPTAKSNTEIFLCNKDLY